MLYLKSLNFNKFKAVQQNNLANVQAAISCGANVNVYGGAPTGANPLMLGMFMFYV